MEEASCGEASQAPSGRACRDIMVRNRTAECTTNAVTNTSATAKMAAFPVKADN